METVQPTRINDHPVQRPTTVTTLGALTLVNGILNVIASLALTGTVVLSTLGIGMLCAPFTLAPGVLGIFEIMYAAKILSNPPQPVKFSQTIAVLEIACIAFGNVISLAVGILAFVFYSDQSVKDYFTSINPQASAQG